MSRKDNIMLRRLLRDQNPEGTSWSSKAKRKKVPLQLMGCYSDQRRITLYVNGRRQGKVPRQLTITLNIPPAVESKIYMNMRTILKIAEKLGIHTSSKKLFVVEQENSTDKIKCHSNNINASIPKGTSEVGHSIIQTPAERPSTIYNLPITNTEDYIKPEPGNSSEQINHKKDISWAQAGNNKIAPISKTVLKDTSKGSNNMLRTPAETDDSDIIIISDDDDIQETDRPSTISNLPVTNTQVYIKPEPGTSSSAQKDFKKDSTWSPEGSNNKIKMELTNENPFKMPNPPYVKTEPGSSTPKFNTIRKRKGVSKKKRKAVITIPIPSVTQDFIPVGGSGTNFLSSEKLSSLRCGGDYKYGYEDIITGTFEEKLDECLSKGVKINLSNPDIQEINSKLYEEYQTMVTRKGYQRLLKFREILTTYNKSGELLEVINNNQVIVISGETGCGKSTQIPQIILDHAICNNRGANVKILVTQPRRIAALSLATRVAEERGERVGNSVGYAVRLEKVDSHRRGSILFCTTGVLLAELEIDQGLTNYSHVILDEVHERDCHIDLSMCMLRKVLQKREELKLILMSATIDADSLSAYFNNCPVMNIEGLAYPVKDVYLEEVLQMTKFQIKEPRHYIPENPFKWSKYRKIHSKPKKVEPDFERYLQYKAEIAPWLESIKGHITHDVYLTLQDPRIEELNVALVCELLIHLRTQPPGAILVFLPGIGDIIKLMRVMNDSNMFPSSLYEIYPLHSKLPTLQQYKIFERPPEPIRKIIIATNIAETSITIDDIVYVIDCGKIKIRGLNVEENVSTLKTEWVSKANLRQRRGRAGRCQPGICYHLLTSYRAQVLDERLLPELQRSDLLEPVLTIKRLRLGIAREALATVPSPPAQTTVQWAVNHLQECGALDNTETLTPLGWHLARLPVHPFAGKLLLFGALFGCLDRAASVAAVWGFKDPFQLVMSQESEVNKDKRFLALGEPSDHVAISEAIIQWEQCPPDSRHLYAIEHFLSNDTLELLTEMKRKFGDCLRQMGFLSSGNVKEAWENRNAENLSLFKAIVAASLYPNIATVRWSNPKEPWKHPKIRVRMPEDISAKVHRSSVMYFPGFNVKLCENPGANWLVYWLKQRTSDLFLMEVTLVYTLPLLFFGELRVSVDIGNLEYCFMSISSVRVRCRRETAQTLYELRMLLDQVLASKVMQVSVKQTFRYCEFEESVLKAVIELITAEDERAECIYCDDISESDLSEN